MPDWRDQQSAGMNGQAKFEEWKARFLKKYFAPMAKDQALLMLARMGQEKPEVLQQAFDADPEGYTKAVAELMEE